MPQRRPTLLRRLTSTVSTPSDLRSKPTRSKPSPTLPTLSSLKHNSRQSAPLPPPADEQTIASARAVVAASSRLPIHPMSVAAAVAVLKSVDPDQVIFREARPDDTFVTWAEEMPRV